MEKRQKIIRLPENSATSVPPEDYDDEYDVESWEGYQEFLVLLKDGRFDVENPDDVFEAEVRVARKKRGNRKPKSPINFRVTRYRSLPKLCGVVSCGRMRPAKIAGHRV